MIRLGLVGVCVLAFLLRALSFEGVFLDDSVLFAAGDSYAHARLALYAFVNLPSILTFDPYINYPDGAAVPMPPLQDFLVAVLARALSDDPAWLERVLAWWSPVVGSLTPIPVYLAARHVCASGTALGAATLASTLPILATASHVGNADHHALQALLGAALLWLCLAAVSAGARLRLLGAALVVLHLGISLAWSGALLYLCVAEGLLLLVATFQGRRDLLAMLALSAAASGLGLAAIVAALPTPAGGAYWALSLSWLYPLAQLGAASVALGVWALEGRRPGRGAGARLVGLCGTTLVVAVSILAWPGVRSGLLFAVDFLGMTGSPGHAVAELMPLFPWMGRASSQPAVYYFGHFAYLIPIAPLAALLVPARERRAGAWLLAGWTAIFGALAIWQVRYGLDFTPAGSIAFSLLLAGLTRPLARARLSALRPVAAVGLGVLLLAVPAYAVYLPPARHSLGAILGQGPGAQAMLSSPVGSMVRFLRTVRLVTPETSGYLEAGRPEYGVLCRTHIGHALHYVARRASASDGFMGIVGRENFAAAQRFFETRSEEEAVDLARGLTARYVVTMFFPGIEPGSIEARLHFERGVGAGDEPPLERFRLVAEGPPRGQPLSDLLGVRRPRNVVPYRLFEVVAGAVLELRTTPGTQVRVTLGLRTPVGERFTWAREVLADAKGVARIRVPYPTEGGAPIAAAGSYRVRAGERTYRVRVSEREVRSGASVGVDRPPSGDGADSLPAV
jgi:asparagine N-glycosylation enzyme membrane subunit Stt3